MNEDNKIFKTNEFSIEVSPVENTKQVKNVQYFSYDENSGLQLIHILMDGKPLDLPNGTEIRLSAVKLNNQNQKLIYTPEIVDPLNGIVSFVIPREFLGYQGRIRCGLYINFSNNQTMHVGYFYINMGVSDIDTNLTEFTEDFWQGWSEFEASSTAKMQELEAVLDAEAKRLTEHANQKITEYDQYIASGKSDWEDFVEQNREIIESVDPGGKILEELIDARNDFESLGERLDNEYKDFSVNTNLDIGATVLSVFEPLIDAMKDTVGRLETNTFKFGFLTDAHYSDMTGFDWFKDQYRSLNHLSNFHEALGEGADALIYGGDNVANESPNIAINTKAQEIFSSKVFDTIMNADRFMLLGNHDNYVPLPTTPDVIFQPIENVYSDEDYSGFYRANQLLFNEQRENGNSLYFYKDYPDKNIRLIGLNTNDNPRVVDNEGKIKYNYNQSLGILQPQIDWLYSVLRETPAEYHTVVVSHSPLTSINDYNSDLVVGMLKAFKNGTAYQDLRTAEDWEAQVSADFTEQGPRKLVGVFSGHLHKEIFSGIDDEIHQISLNSSWFKGQSNRAVADKENTNLEDCWYLINVDTAQSRVNIYGFDAGNNFEYIY
ncbi:hypothetical protein IGK44_001001 [Enterococcus sp. DIV1248a]|uniref:BppU family phage baseplate upper protein n=1 Tax=Enterococcus sp. DIV1248a TaxID=2774836 RepID=UPI003F25187E